MAKDVHAAQCLPAELRLLLACGQVVQQKLWSLYPPSPLTQEEQAERQRILQQAEVCAPMRSLCFMHAVLALVHCLLSLQGRTSCMDT